MVANRGKINRTFSGRCDFHAVPVRSAGLKETCNLYSSHNVIFPSFEFWLYLSSSRNQQSSPASSIRHVLTRQTYNTTNSRDIRHSRESSVANDIARQETPKGVTEETVIFSRVGSPKKKAPPPPPPNLQPAAIVVQPRPFSSVSDSSSGDTSTSLRHSDSHLDERGSFGESSMVNEIFREMEHDRSAPETMVSGRHKHRPQPQLPREYQTFEMIWTEGSESETSSVLDKIVDVSLEFCIFKHVSVRRRNILRYVGPVV